jgi:hypothetical protein
VPEDYRARASLAAESRERAHTGFLQFCFEIFELKTSEFAVPALGSTEYEVAVKWMSLPSPVVTKLSVPLEFGHPPVRVVDVKFNVPVPS